MPRRRRHVPLRVLLNNRLVGHLSKAASGAIDFRYEQDWLDWEHALPISLSLPLREDTYRGEPVIAVFDNLLPDSDVLRRRVAEKVGAAGMDAYSLLAAIGRDCVGALMHQGKPGIRERVYPAVNLRAALAPVPSFPRDTGEEDGAHAEQDPLLHQRVASIGNTVRTECGPRAEVEVRIRQRPHSFQACVPSHRDSAASHRA